MSKYEKAMLELTLLAKEYIDDLTEHERSSGCMMRYIDSLAIGFCQNNKLGWDIGDVQNVSDDIFAGALL